MSGEVRERRAAEWVGRGAERRIRDRFVNSRGSPHDLCGPRVFQDDRAHRQIVRSRDLTLGFGCVEPSVQPKGRRRRVAVEMLRRANKGRDEKEHRDEHGGAHANVTKYRA
jgi:hypothetical protein